jgi:S1-C subfamily serine protease
MGLNLVEMNAGLGEYFGTSEGLLVTEAPRDSTIPLRAGDVILTIGGRTPTSEAHAQRILASYAPGETIKVEIMRKKSRQTVSWTVPERDRVRLMRPTVEGRNAERT